MKAYNLLTADEQVLISECLKMVDITGEVKATDSEYSYILDKIIVKDKDSLKSMSKDILNKPIFRLLHDWITCEHPDYIHNRTKVVKMAQGYLKRYKDIYSVTHEQLYPIGNKISLKDKPKSVADRIRKSIARFKRKRKIK